MKTSLTALVLTAALFTPALAEDQNQNANPSQPQMNSQSGMDSQDRTNNQSATGQQDQVQLSSSEVRSLQQELDKQGFNSGQADGVFGPETKAALEKFQKEKGMNPTGEPNQQTLAALGVNQSQSAKGERSAKAGQSRSVQQNESQGQPQPQNGNGSQPSQGGEQRY